MQAHCHLKRTTNIFFLWLKSHQLLKSGINAINAAIYIVKTLQNGIKSKAEPTSVTEAEGRTKGGFH